MNELILLFILLIINGLIITVYHFYEKLGVKILLVLMTILYLIMSFKTTLFLSLNINLNIVPLASIYTIVLILLEKHSKKELKDNITLIIKTIIFTIPLFLIFILFNQSINDNIILNKNHLIDYIPIFISYILIPPFILLFINLYKYLKEISKSFYIKSIIAVFLTTIIEVTVMTIIIYIIKPDIKFITTAILSNFILKFTIMLINLGIIKIISTRRKWLS